MRLDDRCLANLLNESKAHIRDCRSLIHAAFLFHLTDDVLQHFFFILIQLELVKNHLVAFRQLACRKTNRNARFRCVVLDQMHDTMQTAMHRAIMILRVAKICAPRFFLILRPRFSPQKSE